MGYNFKFFIENDVKGETEKVRFLNQDLTIQYKNIRIGTAERIHIDFNLKILSEVYKYFDFFFYIEIKL